MDLFERRTVAWVSDDEADKIEPSRVYTCTSRVRKLRVSGWVVFPVHAPRLLYIYLSMLQRRVQHI